MDSESVVLLLNNLFFKENNSISEIERKSLSITSNSIIESSKNQLIYSNIFKHLPEKEEIVSMKNCQIVIISSAALRCIEIMKLIISGNKKIKIVKLFAKHIKIKEQVALLKKQKHQLAVATPTRFSALIDILPDLKMNLKYIFIDSSRDAKERTIFDIPETGKPLLDLIYIKLGESIRSGRVKLVFLKQ